jgi:flagellar motor switch protein FliM
MAREGQASAQMLGRTDPAVVGRVEEAFRVAARRVRTRLVNRGGADLSVRFGSAEMASLGVLMDRYRGREGGVYARMRIGPGDLHGMVVIEGTLLQHLIGVMLGEIPGPGTEPARLRPPTKIDLRLAQRVVNDAFLGLIDAAAPGIGAKAKIEYISANPQLGLPLPRSAVVIEASFDFGPASGPHGLLSFLLPVELVNAWWPPRVGREEEPEERTTADGIGRVMPIPITMVAELGRLQLSLAAVRAIRPGTMLDISAMREVQVRIGDRVAFVGEPGEQNGARSVRVRARLDGGSKG